MLLRIGRTVSPIRVVAVEPNIHQDHNEMYGCTSGFSSLSDIMEQNLSCGMDEVTECRGDWHEADVEGWINLGAFSPHDVTFEHPLHL